MSNLLTMQEYLEQSGRTAAGIDTIRRDVFPTDGDLVEQMLLLVGTSNLADYLKRSVFYNESPEKTKERGETGAMKLKLLLEKAHAVKTDHPTRQLGRTRIDLMHAAFGLISEAAEILEAVATSYLDDMPVDLTNMREEFGDVNWYTALGLRASESTFEFVGTANIEKLRIRYPDKFTSEAALTRDLQAEKVALK